MTTERDPESIVSAAQGPISADTLTATNKGGFFTTGYFHDGPLIERLDPDEQLQFLLTNRTKGLTIERLDEKNQIEAGGQYRTAALVTDQRILFVSGHQDGDWTHSIPLSSVVGAASTSGILKDKLVVTADDTEYQMFVRKNQGVEDAVEHLEQAGNDISGIESVGTENSTTSPTETTTREQETIEHDDSSVDETGLPSEETIEWLNEPAAEHIEQARELLLATDDSLGTKERTQVHNRLSFAIDALDETVNDEVSDQIENVLDQIDRDLLDAQSTGNTSGNGAVTPGTTSEASVNADTADATSEEITPSRDDLLDEIRRLDEEHSEKVRRGTMRAYGQYEPETYEDEFGTWSAALELIEDGANESPDESSEGSSNQQVTYSKQDVLNEIREAAKTVGVPPSIDDMNSYDGMSPSPAYRYFDSWNEALQAAGVTATDDEGHSESTDVADGQDQSTDTVSITELPEGKIDQLVVTVAKYLSDSDDQEDVQLLARRESGEDLLFRVWPHHEVRVDWDQETKYELRGVKHEVWDTGDGSKHTLCSTPTLTATPVEEEENPQTTPEGGQDQTDEPEEEGADAPGEGSDIVDVIMQDIELEGGS